MTPLAAPRLLHADQLSRLDRVALALVAIVGVVVGVTLLGGDHVGARVVQASPFTDARRMSQITIRFSEPMNRPSVEPRLEITPPIAGDISWSGSSMVFRPSADLQEGSSYEVVLRDGAESQGGRKVVGGLHFTFRVHGPRIAYLSPADGEVKNIWVSEPGSASSPEQVTHTSRGVVAFDVSPDGGRIAYAERNSPGSSTDLKLLELDTRAVRTLADCGTSVCTNPVWKPDSTQIAYELYTYSEVQPGVGSSSTRVRLVDPDGAPPKSVPLFADPLTPPHYKPRWAPDGSSIAVSQLVFFPVRNPGIRVFNFRTGETSLIPTGYGSTGSYSWDGSRLIVPDFAIRDGAIRKVLDVVSLENGAKVELTEANAPVEDEQVAWQPGTEHVTVSRRFGDAQATLGRQLYSLDVATQVAQPMFVEPNGDVRDFQWDGAGLRLLLERGAAAMPGTTDSPSASIWILDPSTQDSVLVAENAFFPRWVP